MNHRLTRRQWLAAASATGLGAVAGPLRAQDSDAASAPAAAASTPRPIKPAGEANPIVIGQSAQLSGPLAGPLVSVLAGQKLAIDDFNARGGVAGRKVVLVTLDDAYDPKQCVQNTTRLIEQDKVTALFGYGSTANVGAVLPLLAEKQVLLIGPYTGAPNLRMRQHPFFFTTMASYRDEVVAMMKNLKTLLRDNIALVYQANPFGQLMLPVVEEVAKELGVTLVAKAALEVNGSNALAAAQQVGAAHPQALIFLGYGPSMVPLVKAARAWVGAPIYVVSVAVAKPILDALGDDARGLAMTLLLPSPFRPTGALTRDFNRLMTKAGFAIDYDHFFGFVNTRVLLEGLKRAGPKLTPLTLVQTFEKMTKYDLGGYTVQYGPQNHHGSHFVDIGIVGPGGRFIQ